LNGKGIGIGIQLYMLRDQMAADVEGTLRQVAAMGYEGVEFAGYYGWDAEKMLRLLNETGLKAIGGHVYNFQERLDEEIGYLKAIGGEYMVWPSIPAGERETEEDWRRIINRFASLGPSIARSGLQFVYHNHSFEFKSMVDGEWAFDAIFAPPSIQAEIDICWLQAAGQDPAAYIRRYAGRVPLLHIKDFRMNENNWPQTVELGKGIVPLKEVIKAAEESGVRWLIVEQDQSESSALTSAKNNLEWLQAYREGR
jgi:sugar phosphate isomerase/epimerase